MPKPLIVTDLPEVNDWTSVRDTRLLNNLEKMLSNPDVRFHLNLDAWNKVPIPYPNHFS